MIKSSETQKFLSALKKDFNSLFNVKDGAPIAEFWEAYNLAVSEAAQPRLAADACHECGAKLLHSVSCSLSPVYQRRHAAKT